MIKGNRKSIAHSQTIFMHFKYLQNNIITLLFSVSEAMVPGNIQPNSNNTIDNVLCAKFSHNFALIAVVCNNLDQIIPRMHYGCLGSIAYIYCHSNYTPLC